jgi:hypothetical protein
MWVWTESEVLVNLESGSRIYVATQSIYFSFPGTQDVVLANCRSDEEITERLSTILKGVHIGADFRRISKEPVFSKKNEPMHD